MTLTCRNIRRADGRRTSVRLEPAFWEALGAIAQARRLTLKELTRQVDAVRRESSLASALRVYAVTYYRDAALAAAPAERPPATLPPPAQP